MLWGGIIVAAQVTDACQTAIPLSARHRGASALVITWEALLIDSQMEWEDIYSARIDEDTVVKRRHKLMKLRLEADTQWIQNGLPFRKNLFALAESDATAYFRNTYKMGMFE